MLWAVHKLYLVHSSHPSAAVKEALALKGIAYKTVEMPVPTQGLLMRLRFPSHTVPALKLDGGEKVQGSIAIMRRLDELVPDPPLLPADAGARAAVLGAELWGADVLQPLARRVFWGAVKRRPGAVASYQEASQLPRFPGPVVRIVAPALARLEIKTHGADDESLRADLQALPSHLDIVDEWIASGVLGGAEPNAADLQIGSSLRFLSTLGDMRPLLADRPAEELALRLFPVYPGEVPARAYPSGWLPARA
jgi:glutathione S-transferase